VKLSERRMRSKKVRTPGGRTRVELKRRMPSKNCCALCGARLHGMPKQRPSDAGKLAKTEKRPERVFAGVLCGKCVARVLKEKARAGQGMETDLGRFKYVKMIK